MFCEVLVLVGRVVVGFVLLFLTTCFVLYNIEDKEKYLDLGGSRFSNDLNTFENLIT